jgi:hypothetical protein
MTTTEIRIAMAELEGWKRRNNWAPFMDKGDARGELVPDYCNDLNAVHRVEELLNSNQWEQWHLIVSQWTDNPSHATARQRCEAILRTAGKWKESAG